MTRYKVLYYVVILLLLSITNNVFADNSRVQEEWRETNSLLIKSLPKLWNDYLNELGKIEGKIERENKWVNQEGTKVESVTYNMANRYPWTLIESENSVTAVGKNYKFSLTRSDRSWIINSLEKISTKPEAIHYPGVRETPIIDQTSLSISGQLCVGLQLEPNFVYLPAIWEEPNFQIITTRDDVVDNQKAVYIQFEFSADPGHPYVWISPPEESFSIQGELWLTTNYYLISKSKIIIDSVLDGKREKNTNTWEIEYDTRSYSVPLPTKSVYNSSSQGVEYTSIKRYDLRETNPSVSSRFTLSAYGLPEPDFGESRASRMRYILLVTGLLLISLGVWRIYRRKQRTDDF